MVMILMKNRINQLRKGIDSTLEVDKENLISSSKIKFTTKMHELSKVNTYIVTVPTPVDDYKKPDMSALIKISSRDIAKILNKGDVVIYESTVFPGATEGNLCSYS